MKILQQHEEIFTDIRSRTSIIEHNVRLDDNHPIRCRPNALSYAVRGENQIEFEEKPEKRIRR